jgi:hypothetical protein
MTVENLREVEIILTEAPIVKKEVPSNAVKIRKKKYTARFGDRAVPREQRVNKAAVMRQIWRGN